MTNIIITEKRKTRRTNGSSDTPNNELFDM